jgi:tmRNA-binding protein
MKFIPIRLFFSEEWERMTLARAKSEQWQGKRIMQMKRQEIRF